MILIIKEGIEIHSLPTAFWSFIFIETISDCNYQERQAINKFNY